MQSDIILFYEKKRRPLNVLKAKCITRIKMFESLQICPENYNAQFDSLSELFQMLSTSVTISEISFNSLETQYLNSFHL